MGRRFFTFAAALSLLICLATAVLWVWSYRSGCALEHGGATQIDLASEHGAVALVISHPGEAGEPFTLGWTLVNDSTVLSDESTPTKGEVFRYRAAGFEWASYVPASPTATVPGAGMRYRVVAVPHWSMTAILAVLPACWLRQWWTERYRCAGTCPRCGYDLRASTERCPECGTPVPSEVQA